MRYVSRGSVPINDKRNRIAFPNRAPNKEEKVVGVGMLETDTRCPIRDNRCRKSVIQNRESSISFCFQHLNPNP